MKHLGDITKLNGAEIPAVDCICGGSPCQDLSVAGKRDGLKGERSSLFMEQIRIVKEMRGNDRRTGRTGFNIRPRFMVWENVEGAFSSPGRGAKGEDFQAVLTEIARIAEPECPVVPLPNKGKWSKSGAIMGIGADGCPFSIAWRLHNSQLWGVPQRRKRIALVVDFGGLAAPEVLFEREGLRWDLAEKQGSREEIAASTGSGTNSAISFQERSGKPGGGKGILIQSERTGAIDTVNKQMVFDGRGNGNGEIAPTITGDHQRRISDYTAICIENGSEKELAILQRRFGTIQTYEDNIAPTIEAAGGMGGNNLPMILSKIPTAYCIQGGGATSQQANGDGINEEVSFTLNGLDRHAVYYGTYQKTTGALTHGAHPGSYNGQDAYNDMLITCGRAVAFSFDSLASNSMKSKNPNSGCREVEIAKTIDCTSQDPSKNQGGIAILQEAYSIDRAGVNHYVSETVGELCATDNKGVRNQSIAEDKCIVTGSVRRLTPLECERLQGFPDGWTDIGEWIDSKGKKRKTTDSSRYTALGNSLAIPFWFWLLRRISAQYERPATLGSLFDGIGGFPLCWERCNGAGSAIWASEIEDFPIAVTKYHFPE